MRNVLVDHARGRDRIKRGGGAKPVPLEVAEAEGLGLAGSKADGIVDLVALDDALKGLVELDERKARLVELRFFGGLTSEEAGEVLGISRTTVAEDWRFARAWLLRELDDG